MIQEFSDLNFTFEKFFFCTERFSWDHSVDYRLLANNLFGNFCSLESTWRSNLGYLLEFLGLLLLLNPLGDSGFIFFWVLIVSLEMMTTKALWPSFQCGSTVVFLVTNTCVWAKKLRLLLAASCCYLGTTCCFWIIWHAVSITATITHTHVWVKFTSQTGFEKSRLRLFGSSLKRWTGWESLTHPNFNVLGFGTWVVDGAERSSSHSLTAICIVNYTDICILI